MIRGLKRRAKRLRVPDLPAQPGSIGTSKPGSRLARLAGNSLIRRIRNRPMIKRMDAMRTSLAGWE